MKIYNVAVPVVELVSADSEADAVTDLKARLTSAGFDPYEGEIVGGANAFESEELDQPVAEAVASTSDQWHDNCPRCPRCGKHRHGGSCSPLLDAAREAQALNEPAEVTIRPPYEVQELNEGQFWAISGDPGKAEQLGPYATRAEADLAGLSDQVKGTCYEALLCDECYETGTGDLPQCEDDCSLDLSHTGECGPRYSKRSQQETCDRCGKSDRLTREDVTNLDFS